MSIGLSIFLASLIIGSVTLFIATRNSWNWKNILKFLALGVIVFIVLIIIAFKFYTYFSSKPEETNKFWGIPLHSNKSDIKFLKGNPIKENNGPIESVWDYQDGVKGDYYSVDFHGDTLRFVMVQKGQEDYQSLQGITFYSTFQNILDKFGKHPLVFKTKNDLGRMILFKKYHVFFYLEKDHVQVYGMYNPKFGPIRLGN